MKSWKSFILCGKINLTVTEVVFFDMALSSTTPLVRYLTFFITVGSPSAQAGGGFIFVVFCMAALGLISYALPTIPGGGIGGA